MSPLIEVQHGYADSQRFIANRAGTYLSCSIVCRTSFSCLRVPYEGAAAWEHLSVQRSVVSVGQLAEAVIGCHVCTSKHDFSDAFI